MLNKIHVENCLDTMKRMPDEFVDLVVTSPPYDNLRTYNGYSFDFESIAAELFRVVKPGGVIVWVVNDSINKGSKTGTSFKQALHFMSLGFNLHDVMIWQKPNYAPMFPTLKRYDQNFEYMMIFTNGSPVTWNPIKDKPKAASSLARLKYGITYAKPDGSRSIAKVVDNSGTLSKRTALWVVPNGQKRGLKHPAVFPESLASDHIVSWSNKGDVVYDPFMGSGTTAIAAVKLGRRWLGSEISQEYVEIALKRLQDFVGD
jgi:DNA modification methylase